MTIGGSALKQVESLSEDFDHGPSINAYRSMLTSALKEHEDIAASISDTEARADFEGVFAQDVANVKAAIDKLNRLSGNLSET